MAEASARKASLPTVLLLTAPAMLLMLVFLVGPLVCLFVLSFTDYQLGAPSISLVGLANYQEMTGDETVTISIATL